MAAALFRAVFKYPTLVYQQGSFAFGASRGMILAVVVAGAVGALALVAYSRLGTAGGRDRAVLVGARLLLLLLLVFCLLRPTLVIKAAVPQQNFLGVLVDDSASMQVADGGPEPRGAFVRRELGAPGAPLLDALSRRFVLRFFRFSASADRIGSPGTLDYSGTRTDLGQALDRARDELAGLPLAGLVMITDGADTSTAAIDQPLAALKARSIPVFTVGVGQEQFAHDIQVSRVETPRTVLKGTALVVNVVLTGTGYAGATVPLNVEDDGHLVSTQQVTLPGDGESATVPVRFTAREAGARTFRFRVPPQPGEQVAQNNARDALLEVADRREKILYFEGEPRFEPKFVRLAVQDDKNLQLVVLQRTAEDKYLRLNVDSPDELVAGFPKSRDELFKYRGLILGSVEAASFTPEQLRMIADFVSRRGGGLMMLGGRRSFAEGGWAGTPVADVLPVAFDGEAGRKPAPEFAELSVRPTPAGANFPVTQIAGSEQASAKRWDGMPELSTVNPIRAVKPGATVLLTGMEGKRNDQIVLAYQRYGRGKAVAFPVQDSWVWRMDASMPVSDTTYATFWRRLARWLVDGVPGPVSVTTAQDHVDPGEPVELSAQVADSAFVDVNDGRVVAHVTAPSGKTSEVPMDWTVAHEGEYRGTFVPAEQGLYQVKVDAARDGKSLGTDTVHVRAAPGDREYFDAAMRAPLLRRIADETGGRFFTAAQASALPEAISYSGRGVTVVEEHELWDLPVLLVLLVAVMGGEWAYRRARGLA